MMLDLNDYYPSCNLPRLYRERGREGDAGRARVAGTLALKACERAKALDPHDEWLRPTLLGAAFDAQDVQGAERLAREVMVESPATWKLSTTIVDLRVSAAQANEPDVAASLARTFNELNELLPERERLEPLRADPGKPRGDKKKGKKGKKKRRRRKNG